MGTKLKGWMVLVVLLGTMAYAIAEEITLTTYYPSPRGVYKELRTKGDVKIGDISATTPQGRLEVRGSTASTPDKALYVGNVDGDPRLVVQNDGNVGIGTTAPTTKLHITGGADDILQIEKTGTGARKWDLGVGGALAPVGGFFIGDLTGLVRRFVIDTSGNVGIGTTAPADKLDVHDGNVLLSGTAPPANCGSAGACNVIGFGGAGDQYFIGRVDKTGSAQRLQLTGGGAVGSDKFMAIDSSGNVGIGVINPTQRLDVVGQVRIRGGSPATGKVLQSASDGTGSWVGSLSLPNNPSNCSSGQFAQGVDGTLAAEGCTGESDPQVGAVTSGNLCRGDGSAVQCDQAVRTNWGTCTWRGFASPNLTLSCNAGEYVAALQFEGATWTPGNDNHSSPEIYQVKCCQLF